MSRMGSNVGVHLPSGGCVGEGSHPAQNVTSCHPKLPCAADDGPVRYAPGGHPPEHRERTPVVPFGSDQELKLLINSNSTNHLFFIFIFCS